MEGVRVDVSYEVGRWTSERAGETGNGKRKGRAGRPRTRVLVDSGRSRVRAQTAYVCDAASRDAYVQAQSGAKQRFERGVRGQGREAASRRHVSREDRRMCKMESVLSGCALPLFFFPQPQLGMFYLTHCYYYYSTYMH